ncbi:Iron-sulfur cluster regulator IscR [Hyphomicrobium sulfonivorans]|uniref:Iron-sulfur cluster regulator IscR n=1 Tax=Hyphomicrobium sulfonivorans TaxID=121290 RepID=A0A109BKN6_HYPSL|nr:Rrf2 family transcriptional regulator [Hyphomicrobium sulfonivorans]KWT70494.1 Iron-sulfur cluster regulator IscR [Hyphomicrobium sulfonivorans]
MELNTKGRYAVMAMADLAKYGAESAIPLSAIAERQGLSVAYLEQIFLRLRRAGLLESARGRSGGYALARPATDIPVVDILRAVEEETRLTRCHDSEEPGCLGDKRCLTHGLWHALSGHILAFLSGVSLAEVVHGIPQEKLAYGVKAEQPVQQPVPAARTPEFAGQ